MLKPAPFQDDSLKLDTKLTIGATNKLTLADAVFFARHPGPVALSQASYPAMAESYQFLKSEIDNRVLVYGINTNFGDQVNFIDPHLNSEEELYHKAINQRQESIIKSMSCGLGPEVDSEIVKATMMLRAHCLAQGYSGVHQNTVTTIIAHLNADIIPIVYTYGSIGASGDLIPLGTMAACILGEDVKVRYQNKEMLASQAITIAGIEKFKPQMRDGLAMINGTSFMTAIASLALYDLRRLYEQMLIAIAMTLESLHVYSSAYHPLVHQLKHHSGEMHVAKFLMDFWNDSSLVVNLKEQHSNMHSSNRIQDYYSLRAVAQGFGPFSENIKQAVIWIENEMNSINDNPIVDATNRNILHSANFMGYYVTSACDTLKMDISQASTWIHALLANLVHPRKNGDLPANIVPDPTKNNGFRSMQLLSAALAVQNRKFAQSHQAFMLPTEGDNQDVNSLGTHAALDLRESVSNLEKLTAILLLAATQALELRGIEKAGIQSQHVYHLIRRISAPILVCRPLTEEINAVIAMLKSELI